MKIDAKRLLVSIVVCQMAGVIGSFFTSPSIPTWYAMLEKPDFTPPGWVIGSVWITLFLLMGIALYLVWARGLETKGVKRALGVFSIQLILNILWSVVFFGLRNPFYALIEIILLWIAILITIIEFYRIDKKAGVLLVPYILWVTFAAFLNLKIWQLNI